MDMPSWNTAPPPDAVFRECFKCKFAAVTAETQCPKCGKKLQGPREIRTRGVILIAIGIFLAAFMGAIAVFVWLMLAGAMQDPRNAKDIRADMPALIAIYGLFAVVVLFGLHSILIGVWQVIVGRRNKIFIWTMWAILFALLFVAGLTMALIK